MATQINAGTVTVNTQQAQANINKLAKSLEMVNPPLGRIDSNFREFEKSLDAATARVVAFTTTTGLIYGIGDALQRVTRDAIEVEAAMTKVQAILKVTDSELASLKTQLFAIANNTGQTFSEASKALEEFARQGLNAEKTLRATEAALIVARLSGANLEETINGLVATVSSFSNELLDYGKVANTLVGIDARFSTSAAGLIEGIKRVGTVASDAGITFEELGSAIAAVRQVTGRSESVIGNGLKTIFTNLQTDKVQKELSKLGVETKTATGQFLPLIQVVDQLAGAFQKLTDAQRADLGLKIAGKYQINTFKALIQSFGAGDTSLFDQALTTARNSQDEAIKRNELLNQTTLSSLNRLDNAITQLGASFGDKVTKPLVKGFADAAKTALDTISGVFKDSPIGDFLAGGIVSALKGPGLLLAVVAIGKLTKRITKELGDAIASVSGLNSREKENLTINQAILSALKNENDERVRAVRLATTLEEKQRAINNLVSAYYPKASKSTAGSYESLISPALRKQVMQSPNTPKLAGGYLPNMASGFMKEQVSIAKGVGGARSTARAVPARINMSGGRTPVIVNTDEHIIRNFRNSGQDAVFNRDMTRSVGGVSNLKKFGKVEKVMASGYVPASGKLPLNRSIKEYPFIPTIGETYGLNPKKIDFIRGIAENITGLRTNPIQFRKKLGGAYGEYRPWSQDVVLSTDQMRRKKGDYFYNTYNNPIMTAAHEYGHFVEYNSDPELMDIFRKLHKQDIKKKGSLLRSLDDKSGSKYSSGYNKKNYFSESFANTFGYSFLDAPYREYLLKDRSMTNLMQSLIISNIPKNMARGFVPNFNRRSRGSNDNDIQNILDSINADYGSVTENGTPWKSRTLRRGINKDSFVKFTADRSNKIINIEDIESKERGDAFKGFPKIAEFSRRNDFIIRSKALTKQAARKTDGLSGMDLVYTMFPQLRYRRGTVGNTSGEFEFKGRSIKFDTLDSLRSIIGTMSPDEIKSIPIFRNIQDNFADGFVPNFAKPKMLGRGAYGTFYKLKGNIGKKEFKPVSDRAASIANEYIIAKFLNEKAVLPQGVSAPRVIGSLDRSLAKNRIGKEVIEGDTLGNTNLTGTTFTPLRDFLVNSIQRNNPLKAFDLHEYNVMLNTKGVEIANRYQPIVEKILQSYDTKYDGKYTDRFEYNSDIRKRGARVIRRMLSSFAKRGGNMSIVDPGLFEYRGMGSLMDLLDSSGAKDNLSSISRDYSSSYSNIPVPLPLQLQKYSSNYSNISVPLSSQPQKYGDWRDLQIAGGYIPNFNTDSDYQSIISELHRLSPSQRLKFAKSNFRKLGKGSSRIAYDIGGRALKLPLNEAGIAQNRVETDPYMFSSFSRPVLPTIFDEGPDDEFLTMQLAQKFNDKKFKNLVGVSLNQLRAQLPRLHDPNARILPFKQFPNEYRSAFHSIVEEGLISDDLHSKNLGIVTEPDYDSLFPGQFTKDRPVILDYGFTQDVADQYYKRRNLGKRFAGGFIPNFAKYPKLAKGLTRMWRSESKGSGSVVPDWMRDTDEYKELVGASGRWFYKTKKEALDHYKNFDGTSISYVDIPSDEVELFNAKDNPFSGGYGKQGFEYFLSREYANQKRDIGKPKLAQGFIPNFAISKNKKELKAERTQKILNFMERQYSEYGMDFYNMVGSSKSEPQKSIKAARESFRINSIDEDKFKEQSERRKKIAYYSAFIRKAREFNIDKPTVNDLKFLGSFYDKHGSFDFTQNLDKAFHEIQYFIRDSGHGYNYRESNRMKSSYNKFWDKIASGEQYNSTRSRNRGLQKLPILPSVLGNNKKLKRLYKDQNEDSNTFLEDFAFKKIIRKINKKDARDQQLDPMGNKTLREIFEKSNNNEFSKYTNKDYWGLDKIKFLSNVVDNPQILGKFIKASNISNDDFRDYFRDSIGKNNSRAKEFVNKKNQRNLDFVENLDAFIYEAQIFGGDINDYEEGFPDPLKEIRESLGNKTTELITKKIARRENRKIQGQKSIQDRLLEYKSQPFLQRNSKKSIVKLIYESIKNNRKGILGAQDPIGAQLALGNETIRQKLGFNPESLYGFSENIDNAKYLFRGSSIESFAIQRQLGEFTSSGFSNSDRVLGTNVSSSLLKAVGYAMSTGSKDSRPGLVGIYDANKSKAYATSVQSPYDNEKENTLKFEKLAEENLIAYFDPVAGKVLPKNNSLISGYQIDPYKLDYTKKLLEDGDILNKRYENLDKFKSDDSINLYRKVRLDRGGSTLKGLNAPARIFDPNVDKIPDNVDVFIRNLSEHTSGVQPGFISFGQESSSYFDLRSFRPISRNERKEMGRSDDLALDPRYSVKSLVYKKEVKSTDLVDKATLDELRKKTPQEIQEFFSKERIYDLDSILGRGRNYAEEREFTAFTPKPKFNIGKLIARSAANGFVPNFNSPLSRYKNLSEIRKEYKEFKALEARYKGGDEQAAIEAKEMMGQISQESKYKVGPVYHGSGTPNINIFKKKVPDIGEYYLDFGVHFGQKQTAEDYARVAENFPTLRKAYGSGETGNKATIYETFLKAKWLDLNKTANRFGTPADKQGPIPKELKEKLREIAGISKQAKPYSMADIDPLLLFSAAAKKDNKAVRKAVEDNGFTGIKYGWRGGSYVVLNPSQIKSANPFTYNKKGKLIPPFRRFDSRNPDINYAGGFVPNFNLGNSPLSRYKNLSEIRKEYKEFKALEGRYKGGDQEAFDDADSMIADIAAKSGAWSTTSKVTDMFSGSTASVKTPVKFARGGLEALTTEYHPESFWTLATEEGMKVAATYRDSAGRELGRSSVPKEYKKIKNKEIENVYQNLPDKLKAAVALGIATEQSGFASSQLRNYAAETFDSRIEFLKKRLEESMAGHRFYRGFDGQQDILVKEKILTFLNEKNWSGIISEMTKDLPFANEVVPALEDSSLWGIEKLFDNKEEFLKYANIMDEGYYFDELRSINKSYLMIDNPLKTRGTGTTTPKLLSESWKAGYDSVWNDDAVGSSLVNLKKIKNKTPEIVVQNPNAVKSAEPFTYDKKGKLIPPFRRFDSRNSNFNYANGFIPNFAQPQELGKGLYGTFYKLRGKIGKKVFNRYRGTTEDIEREYEIAKFLNEMADLPSGVSAPKIIGNLERSLVKRRIGKEVIEGEELGTVAIEKFDEIPILSFIRRSIEKNNPSLLVKDLHSGNVMLNKKGIDLAGNYSSLIQSMLSKYSKSDFITRRSRDRLVGRILSSLARRGGELSIVDPGLFEFSETMANGFIPNFNNPLKQSINREVEALVNLGYPKSMAAGSVKIGTNERLKNKANPMGLGVYNLAQGQFSLGQAIGQHSTQSQSEKFVPNFADPESRRIIIPGETEPKPEVKIIIDGAEDIVDAAKKAGSIIIDSVKKINNPSGKLYYGTSGVRLPQIKRAEDFAQSRRDELARQAKTQSEVAVRYNQSQLASAPESIRKIGVKLPDVGLPQPLGTIPKLQVPQASVPRGLASNYYPARLKEVQNLRMGNSRAVKSSQMLIEQSRSRVEAGLLPLQQSPLPDVEDTVIPSNTLPNISSSVSSKAPLSPFNVPSGSTGSPINPFNPSYVNPQQNIPKNVSPNASEFTKELGSIKYGSDPMILKELVEKFKDNVSDDDIKEQLSKFRERESKAFKELESKTGIFSFGKKIDKTASKLNIAETSDVIQQRKNQIAERRGRALTGVAFGLPFVSGGIISAMGGMEKKEGRLASAGFEAAGTIALGAQFGPLGLAVSSAAAGLQLLTSATKEFRPNIEELSKKSQELSASNEKQLSSMQRYSEALGQLKSLSEGGASPALIAQAKNELSQSAALVGGEYSTKFLSASTDEERVNIMQQATASAQRNQAALDTRLLSASIIDKEYTGIGGGIDQLTSSRRNIKSTDISTIASELLKTVDVSKISSSTEEKLKSGKASLNDLGIDTQQVNETLKEVDKFFIDGSKKASDSVLKLVQSMVLMQKTTNDMVNAQVESAAAFGRAKESLVNLIQASFASNEIQNSNLISKNQYGIENASNILSNAQQSISPESLIRGREMIAKAEAESIAAAERKSINTEFSQKTLSGVLSKISNAPLSKQMEVNSLVQANLTAPGGFDPTKLASELEKVVDPDIAKSIQSELLQVNIEMAQKMNETNNKLAIGIQKAEDQTEISKKQLSDSRLLNMLGGYQSDIKGLLKSIKMPEGGFTREAKGLGEPMADGKTANLGEAKMGTAEGEKEAGRRLEILRARAELIKSSLPEKATEYYQDTEPYVYAIGEGKDAEMKRGFRPVTKSREFNPRQRSLEVIEKQAQVLRESQLSSQITLLGQQEVANPLEVLYKGVNGEETKKLLKQQIDKTKEMLPLGQVPQFNQQMSDLVKADIAKFGKPGDTTLISALAQYQEGTQLVTSLTGSKGAAAKLTAQEIVGDKALPPEFQAQIEAIKSNNTTLDNNSKSLDSLKTVLDNLPQKLEQLQSLTTLQLEDSNLKKALSEKQSQLTVESSNIQKNTERGIFKENIINQARDRFNKTRENRTGLLTGFVSQAAGLTGIGDQTNRFGLAGQFTDESGKRIPNAPDYATFIDRIEQSPNKPKSKEDLENMAKDFINSFSDQDIEKKYGNVFGGIGVNSREKLLKVTKESEAFKTMSSQLQQDPLFFSGDSKGSSQDKVDGLKKEIESLQEQIKQNSEKAEKLNNNQVTSTTSINAPVTIVFNDVGNVDTEQVRNTVFETMQQINRDANQAPPIQRPVTMTA